jgi:hypothetical protein
MPQMGFEPTIPAFERAERVHALDSVATIPAFERVKRVHALDSVATVIGGTHAITCLHTILFICILNVLNWQ